MENETVNVVLVQYFPKFKSIDENIQYLTQLLSKYKKEDLIDIIVFPEMTLTGYIFDNVEDIKPYLSNSSLNGNKSDKSNKTFEFCISGAQRLNSYVFLGYPEQTLDNKGYNSCLIINRKGEYVSSYHKHFLYQDDKTWSIEGDKFGYMEIQTHSGKQIKLGIGICMDINPYEFTAPFDKMEFATHCGNNNIDCIIFLTNWTDDKPEEQTTKAIFEGLNYWAIRLSPFYNKKIKKNIYFLAADRTGKEKSTSFLGCSCIMQLTPELSVGRYLNKTEANTIYEKLPINEYN